MRQAFDELARKLFLLRFDHDFSFCRRAIPLTRGGWRDASQLIQGDSALNLPEAEGRHGTLRYYEYIELLRPEKDGRSRFYGPREIARMTLILRGRRWGFSLEEIRQWLLIYEEKGTDAQYEEFVRLADRQLKVLNDERIQLDETIADLEKARKDVAEGRG